MIKKLMFAFVAILILAGCRATKDRKALGRVLANDELRNTVYEIEAGKHVIPLKPVYLPGDTIIVYDTVAIPFEVVKYIQEKCPELNVDSLKEKLTTTITKTTIIRDTIIKPDSALYSLYQVTLLRNNKLEGEIAQLNKQTNDYKKSSTNKTWAIIGLIVLLVGGILGAGYFIFKPSL